MTERKQGHMNNFTVTVPGSKSITNRALLLAALAEGKTVLKGTLFSNDSRVFIQALIDIGYDIIVDEEKKEVIVYGKSTDFVRSENADGEKNRQNIEPKCIYVGSAGTAARFLTAMLALSGGCYDLDASEQMRKRPMKPLLEALEYMGVAFEYKDKPYAFPFRIIGYEKRKITEVLLNIDESSQFLSALLMAGVLCDEGIRIHLTGTRNARAYVAITERMMNDFGGFVKHISADTYEVPAGTRYIGKEYQIEPDVSAACYFYALAAVSGRTGKVKYVHKDSMQGDIRFVEILEQMGCTVEEEKDGIIVTGPKGKLKGIDVEMSDFSDQTMTLAAIAPFADSKTVIRGVAHIRGQESDRIHGTVSELKRLGVPCEEKEDGLVIEPIEIGEIQPVAVKTYDDHRMAMSFAILASQAEGVTIENPECCAKTFENFFEVLESV